MQALHELEYGLRVPLVQIPGRLIGQQKRRLIHQRASNGHTLLLAAGELSRSVLRAAGQSDFLEPTACNPKRFPKCDTTDELRHRYVFRRCEVGQQVMPLPDKSNGAAAKVRKFRV